MVRKMLTYFKNCFVYILLFLALSMPFDNEVKSAQVVDRVVAVVNDDIVTLYELNRAIQPYADKIGALGYLPEKEKKMLFTVREDMLNQLIDQKIKDQEIRRHRIKINEKEVDLAIEHLKKANYFSDEDLREALSKDGLTLEEYRGKMKEQILRAKLIDFEVKSKIVITKEEIKSYYENHIEKYSGEKKYHLRNIIMKVPPFAGEKGKAEVREKMETVLAKLTAGESFETLATLYSESSFASDGGDLGLFRLDEISEQLKGTIKDLKAGDFTSVLDTDQGLQIFFVEEIIISQAKSLEEVTPEIEKKLYNEIVNKKFQTWLEGLRKRAHIKIIR